MAANNYPFEIKNVPPEITAEFRKYCSGPNVQYIYVGPEKYWLPNGFRQECLKIYNMKLRPDDIFVATFPKSGTTLTQELVWLIANNFDYDTATKKLLKERFPFLEVVLSGEPAAKQWILENVSGPSEAIEEAMKIFSTSMTDVLAKAPSPRFIKTHLAFSLLPPGLLDTAKVVYVARDPRDVAVSYYHHCRMIKIVGFQGDFKIFWKIFLEGGFAWCGPFFPHVKEAWAKRNHPNMLFLFYEELSKDLPAAVRRVAKFLKKPVTEEEVLKLCDHLHIDNFRKNKSVNAEELQELGFTNKGECFIRKGKTGGWRAYFDEEMTQQAERWIEQNLEDTDLRFPNKD